MDKHARTILIALAAVVVVALLAAYLARDGNEPPPGIPIANNASEESVATRADASVQPPTEPEPEPAAPELADATAESPPMESSTPPVEAVERGPASDPEQPEPPRGGQIAGVVTLDGAPYPGVRIDVLDEELNVLKQGDVTDRDGAYLIDGVPAGEHKVRAIVGERRLSLVAVVADGMLTTVDVPFDSSTASFSGRVVINGNPPRRAIVRGWVYVDGGEEQFNVRTDETGVYRSEGFLPPGEAKLVISAHGIDGNYYRRETLIQLEEGIETITDFEFDVAGGAHGVLKGFQGGGEGGVSFFPPDMTFPQTKAEFTNEAFHRVMDSVISFAYASSDGSFKATGLEPGEYAYSAFWKKPGNEAAAYRDGHYAFGTVTIAADQSVEIVAELKPLPDE